MTSVLLKSFFLKIIIFDVFCQKVYVNYFCKRQVGPRKYFGEIKCSTCFYLPFFISAPINGKFGEWSDYSKCSETCGGGIQNRTRKCDNPAPANGGADCVGKRTETHKCSIKPCPVDGVFGNWSNYSTCTVSCGEGVQYRERKCDSPPPKHGGKDCDGPTRESRTCKESDCPGSLTTFKQQI